MTLDPKMSTPDRPNTVQIIEGDDETDTTEKLF